MNKSISATTRNRLDAQGMCDIPDAEIAAVIPWNRMAFFLCGVIAGVGTALASPTILFALVLIAFLGVLLPVHPFDLIYNLGIRHLRKTGPLPKRAAQVRFACGVGGAWLIATGLLFQNGSMTAGYILGGVLVFMTMLVSFFNICIASYIYNALFPKKVAA